MSDTEKRMLHAAMRSTNEFGAMVRHYVNLVNAAEKSTSPSQEVTDGLKRDLAAARRDFAVARTVLGQILGSTEYDVFGLVEGGEEFLTIQDSKVEAELEKWRAKQQGVSA